MVASKPRRASKDGQDGRAGNGKGGSDASDAGPCPLCGRAVAGDGGEAAAALNRHFETDCTWRHTSRSPVQPKRGR